MSWYQKIEEERNEESLNERKATMTSSARRSWRNTWEGKHLPALPAAWRRELATSDCNYLNASSAQKRPAKYRRLSWRRNDSEMKRLASPSEAATWLAAAKGFVLAAEEGVCGWLENRRESTGYHAAKKAEGEIRHSLLWLKPAAAISADAESWSESRTAFCWESVSFSCLPAVEALSSISKLLLETKLKCLYQSYLCFNGVQLFLQCWENIRLKKSYWRRLAESRYRRGLEVHRNRSWLKAERNGVKLQLKYNAINS